jgi:predicted  nucleic acid-binding Zn-ribbon protein
MSKELKKRQAEVDKQHKALFEQKQGLLNQVQEIEIELYRLQGEYRLLENMIQEGESKEEKRRGGKNG